MKDKEIKKLIKAEEKRQKKVINLIASENYTSKDVREALGSVFTNKYAEGTPGKRFYGGGLKIEKKKKIFKIKTFKNFFFFLKKKFF